MMQMNTRSVLRPEYLNYTPSEYLSYNSFYSDKFSEKRINTNTAPVYSSNNPGPPRRKIMQKRTSAHPYFCPGRAQPLLGDNPEFVTSSEHTAFHTGAPTVPIQMEVVLPETRWAQESNRKPKAQLRSPRQFQSSVNGQRSPDSSTSSSPAGPCNASSHPRSYSHGQAEQLRRSRESTTFALIDNQLSKPPLNQVRDMYLQNRLGVNTSSSAPARTTKKANLSAVHTVVRFRIKEYLLPMMGHMRRMLDILFSSLYPDYNPSLRDVLASQLFGQSQLPCSLSCEFCERFRCQLDRQLPSRKIMFSKTLMSTKPPLSEKSYINLNPIESFDDHVLSPIDSVETERQFSHSSFTKPEPSSTTTPLSSPSSPLISFDALEPTSGADILEDLQEVVNEVNALPLTSAPFDDIPVVEHHRVRFDSLSARLQEAFDLDSMYMAAGNSDFDGLPDDPVDLQSLIFGTNSDVKFESFSEETSTLPTIEDIEVLSKTPLLDYVRLDSDVSIKPEPYLPLVQPNSCNSSSSSCESHQHY